eukprot:885844-Amphidinium_carterae.1
MLPEGLYAMRATEHFRIYANGFTGRISDAGVRAMSHLDTFRVGHNFFEGSMPSPCHATSVLMSHNRFAGSIPDRVLEGCKGHGSKEVIACE